MGCGCNKKKGDRWKVTLKNGLPIEKASEQAAREFAAKHPGSTVSKA